MQTSIDLSGVKHHPAIEEVVDVLCNRTENTDRFFFRATTAYFLAKMASSMRAVVSTLDRGDIPVNTVALANSGYGKGTSVNLMENELLLGFKRKFMGETLPIKADESFWQIANEAAAKHGTDPEQEHDAVEKAYRGCGAYLFTFDNATPEGVKQLRHKLLLADAGSINYQVDEIGSNLERSIEILTLFLELYDQGQVKAKLIKNTADNKRAEELDGKTPTNMLLFGTPQTLFDGSNTENAFYSLLETGYARRCIFGYGIVESKLKHTKTAAEIYFDKINPKNSALIQKWSQIFELLAEPANFGWTMKVEDDVAIQLMTYQMDCEARGAEMKDFQATEKTELVHRFWKAIKLAGVYAFIDKSDKVTMDHLMSAILLVEESGLAFSRILTREKNYVRLCKYIADVGTEVTHPDLLDALPFYPRSNAGRMEMMALARTYGYKNNIIIKKTFRDDHEFFKGETLKQTDLERIILSYSNHFAYEYDNVRVPFADIGDSLAVAQDLDPAGNPNGQPMNWCNHHFKNGHRSDENVIPGFNLITLDVDGGISLSLVHELLADIKHMTYTTKRSTDAAPRFRLLIPTNYELQLDKNEYKELVSDVVSWLPFEATGADIDEGSAQRSKKWLSNPNALVEYRMTGDLFDILPFIPKTKKNEDYRNGFRAVESMDNLERWFASRMAEGNRNDHMIRFALALVDGGMDLLSVRSAVLGFNAKLPNPLDTSELDGSVMVTVAKRISKKEP
jgi:hypothetical protein